MPYLDVAKNRAAVILCQNRHRKWLYPLKESTPCADCGGFFRHYCTDYDHVGDDKVYSISKMVGHARLRVLAEIAKCELVCIRCHRTRTHRRKVQKKPSSEKQAKRTAKRLAIKSVVDNLKLEPCMDCDGTFDPWQMDFDHRPGTNKVGSIAAVLNSLNEAKVLAEIEKCDLVCALCHRIRTHERNDYVVVRPAPKSDGREAWRANFSIKEQDKDVAVQMYLDGNTMKDVAKLCGVTDPVVRKLLDDRGVPRRGRGKSNAKLSSEQQDQAIALYGNGLAARVVGERFGVSEDVILLCLRRNDIPRRRRCDPIYAGIKP